MSMDSFLDQGAAEQMYNAAKSAVEGARDTIQNGTNNFAAQMKNVWRDGNAKIFIGDVKTDVESILKTLNSNWEIFVKALHDVAQNFAETGNYELTANIPVSAEALSYTININPDEFEWFVPNKKAGFLRSVANPEDLVSAFNTLVSDIDTACTQAQSAMASLEAFGAENVNANFAGSMKKLLTITKDNLSDEQEGIKKCTTAQDASYTAADTAAQTASDISQG